MKLELIGLCLVFIFCLTLKGSKVGASSRYGDLVDSTLNLVGVTPPTTAAEWETAFLLLSSRYETMRTNLSSEYAIMKTNLSRDYELMKTNLSRDYELMKTNLSRDYELMKSNLNGSLNQMNLLYEVKKNESENRKIECDKCKNESKNEIERCKNETEKWKREYIRVASVQIIRGIVENGEETMTYDIAFPDKNLDMKKALQKDKGYLDDAALSEAQNLNFYETAHRLKWLYYMTYAEAKFAEDLRNLLRTWNVSAFRLSGLIDRIYKITCEKIHNLSDREIDLNDAEAGLRMYGVNDDGLVDCIRIIWQIPKMTGFLNTTTTPDPNVSEQNYEN